MVFVDKAYQTALGRIEAVERSGSSFLDLRNLKLRTLPSEIGKLSNIEELYINLNMLTSIPPEIGKLANLKKLYVNSNRLKSIPPEIGNLISLEEFFISNNELNFIPQEIGNLTELKTLDLHDNRITILPSEIKNLKKLKRLDLQRNRLSKIPEEVFDLSMPIGWNTTKGLDVDNNPLTSPPIEVFKQGVGAVRAYFKEIGVEETVRLFEAKMLIVGQGSVGKTYLMKRLIYDDINSDIISTEGIDIDKWLIKTKQTEKFLVNFWDFGGQEIYHATHQFFLTKRSLYLFVWEARTDADLLSFDYWLNTVKVLSASSPVIVIQNKIDERKKSINQDFWKKLFPNIVEYHDVSAIEAIGVDGLKLAITREIEKLPHIGDLLPKRWIIIRQQMEKLDVNFITYSQYKDICTEFGMNEAQADRLSEYYHDLGVFLNFKQNPILRHTIFLKPEWATNAVYKVIDNPSVKDNYGKFHFRQLTDIWRDKREFPVDIQMKLVELMKSFELCFELPNGQEYIIPELLRPHSPEFNWDYTQNLRFKYQYDFMPAGIITRFIVITHDLIQDDVYWKDGVVLTWEKNQALISKTDIREIELWIKGDDPKTLLGLIRRHMSYIHKPFSNLNVNEMVPCVCSECIQKHQPYFYPYQNLKNARQKGRTSIECQKSFEPVLIEQLFGGIEIKKTKRRNRKGRSIKVFLASSGELKTERQAIELLIGKFNRKLHYQECFMELVIWEDLKHTFHGKRIQDYFNEKMLECDIVICLFFRKVGNFTKEEFKNAYRNFKKGKKPNYLYVYFKSCKVEIEEVDEEFLEILKIKKIIEGEEQIYNSFKSKEDLVLKLGNQFELIIKEKA